MRGSEDFRERYLQCPYCQEHSGGHQVRVPKSIGKFRVRIIHNNILIFQCGRCGRISKVEIVPKFYFWEYMGDAEQKQFKLDKYKGGKRKNGKN